MPVIGIAVDMLLERIDTPLDREQLVEHLQHLGCDVEGYATMRRFGCARCGNIVEITASENPPVACDRCGTDFREDPTLVAELGQSDVIRMELLAVRPDMFDPGGLARVLRNYLGERDAPAVYQLAPASLRVEVDPALSEASSLRPCIACAIVRDLSLDSDRIKTIMKLQENLHWALGRDRKRASIGVYDLDTLRGSVYRYHAVESDEIRFVPLGYVSGNQATPRQILEQHPKGKAYARLLEGFSRYPLLSDGEGQVLSMPPIINSEQTRLTERSRNLFIDVTGTEQRVVDKTLNVLVTAIAELDRKARLEAVTIAYPGSQPIARPDLTPQRIELQPKEAAQTIGVSLSAEEVMQRLRQMGHGVTQQRPDALGVDVPAYRNDILHSIDLVEDVAIAYGYHNIVPTLVPTMTVGRPLPIQQRMEVCRRALCGLGFFEVLTLILSSETQQFDALLAPRGLDCVQIENPISVEQTIVRRALVPGLLDTLAANSDHEMPQLIFEVGNVSRLDSDCETGAIERCHLAAAAIGPKVDYAQIRSTADAVLRELGVATAVLPDDTPWFTAGRGAQIVTASDGEQRPVGQMGEVHPQVLENFKLVQPAAVFEVELELLSADDG